MATGVPRRRSSGAAQASDAASGYSVRLDYRGKRSVEQILAPPPAVITTAWEGTNVPAVGDNRLYYGDNLGILARLVRDRDVCGKVKLVYIDPPFATRTTFHSRALVPAYDDTLAGAEYIEFLRSRLVLLRELLASDGSIYLHLDDKMLFQMKIIMDEVFGTVNYKNCIVRKKCNPKNYTRRKYGNVADFILFYTKTNEYVWNKPVEPWTKARAKEYQYIEPKTGRRFMKVPIHAPGVRQGATGTSWRGMLPPPGKHWQFPPSTLDEMDARGDIFWSASGNPRRKVYLDESAGVGVQDIWTEFRDAHNQNIRVTGYPTEKNPDLLRRIIEASSRPGDLVLDCFSGSGTTLAVASELERRWLGVDNSLEAIATTLKRFKSGMQPMGSFVSQRNGSGTKTAGQTQSLPLFDPSDLDQDIESGAGGQTYRQINDFRLCVESGLTDSVAELVKNWTK